VLQLPTNRDYELKCSHWRLEQHEQHAPQPVVVYLHSTTGSRLEALPLLTPLLSAGFSVFAFDFGGAGHSTAEYITFGSNERYDLEDVLGLLGQILVTPQSHKTTTPVQVVLWGRSLVRTHASPRDKPPSCTYHIHFNSVSLYACVTHMPVHAFC
jgi:pimeloyl-ACP methyl ester carboxylesterase